MMNGGIDQQVQQRVDAYRSKPQELQQSYAKNQQLIDLLALQKLKSEKEAAARQMQMQTQQNPQTIAQQREAELMQMTKNEMAQQQGALQKQQAQEAAKRQQSMGIAGVPAPNMARMASGGVVGFAGPQGSLVQGTDLIDNYGLDLPVGAALPSLGYGERRAPSSSRKEQLLQMVKDGKLKLEDVEALTAGELVGKTVNDRPVIEEKGMTAREAGQTTREVITSALPDVISPIKRTASAAADVAGVGGDFLGGFFGIGGQDGTDTEALPDTAIEAKSESATTAEQRGATALPKDETTAIGTGTGIASVAPKQRSLDDFGGALPTDVAALRTRMDEAYGTLPELTVPEVQLPDAESILSKYSDPMYERTMQQRGRTPEEIAAREKMIADREALYAEINDPEQAKRDRLWSTLAGAAGTGNLGMTGRNMLASSQGARSAQQAKRLKGLEAIQTMKMEDQKFRDENRAAGALAGYNFANTGFGQESLAARETAGRQWDQSKSLYDTAVSQGKDIFDTLNLNEKTNLQGEIDLAKLSATEYANLLKEVDSRRYQYEAKLTDALKEMQGIEMDLLGPMHPAMRKEQAAAAKGIPSDDPIWAQIEREKRDALMGNYQYAALKAQADNLRKMLSIDLLSELSDKYSMTPAE